MSKLVERLRDCHISVGVSEMRYEAADRIEALEATVSICNQFLLEVSHAMQCGPDWYTKGESGLHQQIYMWIERTRKALAKLEPPDQEDKG